MKDWKLSSWYKAKDKNCALTNSVPQCTESPERHKKIWQEEVELSLSADGLIVYEAINLTQKPHDEITKLERLQDKIPWVQFFSCT